MHISEVNIYPVKSLKGISLSESVVEGRGLQYDRRWMLVDDDNRQLTQREVRRMALVKIEVDDGRLSARFGDMQTFIPLAPGSEKMAKVTVWEGIVPVSVYDDDTNDWFSKALELSCRLVSMPKTTRRIVDPAYAVNGAEDVFSFADAFPFLLIGDGSLADLNSRLDTPVLMNRFRPNLVAAGAEAFAEDNWKKIRVGETIFHVVKSCSRCVLTTVDQSTGEKTGKEPLKTLSTYRNRDGRVLFGQNLIAENPGGVVRTGDRIQVVA